ncbi:transferase [Lithospermum erythrorhizon]|uniref:Glycosyltransferase n=1 Tax=Lithospermum erythrorhizon TaxID=34254 RepID=A0AAV3R686_LITER
MEGNHSASKPSPALHVFMISFPAQGHVNPLLRLANYLASQGLLITFCTTESFGKKMRKANNILSHETQPSPVGLGSIRFEFFDDELDENDKTPLDYNWYVPHLELIGKQKLPMILKNQEEQGFPFVCCLVNNSFIPWASDVAESLDIPSAVFWVQSCACFSAYFHYYNSLVPFPTKAKPNLDVMIPFMPPLKYDEVPSFLHPFCRLGILGEAILGQFKNLSKSFCILMDTVQEYEAELVDYMSKFSNIKSIGPLFKASDSSAGIRADSLKPDDSCIEFLDSKPQSSVVYVSFGTHVYLKQEQIDEIAHGLLSSELLFLWVMKPPKNGLEPHVLPEGFLDKVGDKGKIVKWSNQEEVLAHPSIACFVTHCGWNSTMEALANGVPLLLFPQWGDQVTNAKYLVDVFKVGVLVCRGEAEHTIITRDEIEKCLFEATKGLKASEMRDNALKWKNMAEEAVAEGGSSGRNILAFIDELMVKANK